MSSASWWSTVNTGGSDETDAAKLQRKAKSRRCALRRCHSHRAGFALTMGILSHIAGGKKIDLIRQLLIERVQNDENARKAGFTAFAVRQLSDGDLLGSTEAAIVSIIETYTTLCRQGVSELDAINRIEAHRVTLGRGRGGPPSNLSGFVHYRVGLEHQGTELLELHVELCIEAATHFFTYLDDKGDAANSVKYAKLFVLERSHAFVMDALTDYFEGDSTEEQFIDLLTDSVLSWSAVRKERSKKHAQGKFLMMLRDIENE